VRPQNKYSQTSGFDEELVHHPDAAAGKHQRENEAIGRDEEADLHACFLCPISKVHLHESAINSQVTRKERNIKKKPFFYLSRVKQIHFTQCSHQQRRPTCSSKRE
jgi:hypothetical protein